MRSSCITTRAFTVLLSAVVLLPAEAASRCSLAHYPIAVGDVNEYRMTSLQLDAEGTVLNTMSYEYKDEVTSVEDDRYRTKSTSEANTSESTWECSEEGIELQFGEFPDTTITTTGVTVPAQMEIGGTWIQKFETKSSGLVQTSTTVNRITAREEVTVPAGTFDAFRVDYEIESRVPGLEPSVVHGTQWFAPGAGIVKSTSTIEMEGEIRTVETTIELVNRISR